MSKLLLQTAIATLLSMSTIPAATARDVEVVRSERYGVSPSHRLNLFINTAAAEEPKKVLTIIGGTDQAELDAWDETASWFAERGYSVVVAGYRPFSEMQWPQGPDEMRDIAGWVRASLERLNAARDGMMMDEQQGMYVLATGIGANHIAAYAYHEPSHMGRGASGIQAAALVNTAMLTANQQQVMRYFKQDPNLLGAGQPIPLAQTYAEEAQVQLLLVDPVDLGDIAETHNELLKQTICETQPVCPQRVKLEVSSDDLKIHLLSADEMLMQQIANFFESTEP